MDTRDRFSRILKRVALAAAVAVPVLALAVFAQTQPPEPPIHRVVAGDTLSGIASRYDVTVEAIMIANGLTTTRIVIGQELIIPQEGVPEENGPRIHTVRRGETLSQIARLYGIDLDALAAANGLPSVNSIREGQELVIPGAVTEAEQPPAEQTYTLKRGESLYQVALLFGVTVEDLLAANSLPSPNAIYPGLVVRIPSGDVEAPRTHIVQVGDTLAEIALRYGVTVDGLIAANGLRSTRIEVGQVLVLPGEGAPARPPNAVTGSEHVVQVGETLAAIALRYGVTVHALAAANGLLQRIAPGQRLTIPAAQAGLTPGVISIIGSGRCEDAIPARSGTGYYITPTRDYVITRGFTTWHQAVDFAADTGTPIFAADGGTVVFAGWNPAGYGNLVILDHGNGWRSFYAHLNEVSVGCDQWVRRGKTIGTVGTTGNSTGPHLHFELYRLGVQVDPAGFLTY